MKNLFTILLGIALALSVSAQVTISPSATAICQGDTAIYTAVVPGYNPDSLQYMWLQNGVIIGNTSSVMVNPSQGLYNITVNVITIDSTWVGNGSATLTVNPTPAVTAGFLPVSCFGDSTGLVHVPQNGLSYLWSTGDTTQTVYDLPAGSYVVTVTNSFGCSAIDTTVITQPLAPLVVESLAVDDVTCFGANDGSITVNVSGGVGFYSYNWSNGGIGNSQTNLAPGSYTVTVTDGNGNGCSTSATATVGQGNQFTANATGSSLMCFGDDNGSATVTVTGGTQPYSYLWNNGSITPTIYGLLGGTYSVIVTDANGCTTTASAVVSQPEQMVAFIEDQIDVSCYQYDNGSIVVGATGGTEPYSPLVVWNDGFEGGPVRTGLSPGVYTATITDANGCSASITTTVTGPSSPITTQWYNQQNPCYGVNNGGISVNVFGGTPPYTLIWEDEDLEGQVLTGLGPGNYLVTVIDGNGCVAGPFGQMLVANPEIVITTPNVINYCIGSGDLILATGFGGTQPYGQTWFDPQGFLFDTSEGIEPIVNGQYMGGIWTLIMSDGLGCNQTGYITVNLVTCPPTSVGEQLEKQISLFPNPVSSGQDVTIQLPSSIKEVEVKVIDFIGKTIFECNTCGDYRLSTSGLAAGTYFVQIATDDGSVSATKKFIIQ